MPIGGPASNLPSWPDITTSVDFTHDPTSTLFTWVDLTHRTLTFTTTRGRSYELTSVSPGQASVDWDNGDGALDPTNASSPYSPNVIPYRRIQIAATWAGTPHLLYTGMVERWPLAWSNELGSVSASCVDVMTLLANKILGSFYEKEILLDAPTAFYPLAEPSGAPVAADVSGNHADSLVPTESIYGPGTLSFGSGTAVLGLGGAVSMSSADTNSATSSARGTYLTASGSTIMPVSGASGFSAELWFQVPAANPVTQLVLLGYQSGSVQSFSISVGDVPGVVLGSITGPNPGAGSINLTGTTSVTDGNWHHVVLTLSGDGKTGTIYLDGNVDSAVTVGSSIGWTGNSGAVNVGISHSPTATTYFDPLTGSVAGLAFYGTVLSSTRIAAHHSVGSAGLAGDTADARISRILGYAGWTGATALDACTTTMLSMEATVGQSALSAIQTVEQSEGGTFYVAPDGTLTYKSRHTRMLTTTSAYTFGENDSSGELPYEDIGFDFDPTYVYNDIEITRESASTVTDDDATSQGHYGIRTYSKTLNIQSDAEAADTAAWLLAVYKDPHLRVASITLNPASNANLWPACLSMDVGTRITVKRRARGSANTISADYFVEQVKHDIDKGAGKWLTTLALSPIPVQAFILDDPTNGVLDTSRLGY